MVLRAKQQGRPTPTYFECGPDDLLVISTDRALGSAARERIERTACEALSKTNRTKCLVLDGGLRIEVIKGARRHDGVLKTESGNAPT